MPVPLVSLVARCVGFSAMACVAIGCGSATAVTSKPAVGAAFASRAVTVCQAAHAQNQQLHAVFNASYANFNPTQPDRSVLPAVAQFMAKTRDTYKAWLSRMQALGQPPTGQAVWADVLKAIQTHVRLEVDEQAAAQRGDTNTFTQDYYLGAKAQDALLHAVNAAGVPQCAAVDR
jgi:hypothetical protein